MRFQRFCIVYNSPISYKTRSSTEQKMELQNGGRSLVEEKRDPMDKCWRVIQRWRNLVNKVSLDFVMNGLFAKDSVVEANVANIIEEQTVLIDGGDYIYWPMEWSQKDPAELGRFIKASEIEANGDGVEYDGGIVSITSIEAFFESIDVLHGVVAIPNDPEKIAFEKQQEMAKGDDVRGAGCVLIASNFERLGYTYWPREWRQWDPLQL